MAFAVPVHLALKFESANAVFLSILIVAFDSKAHLRASRHQIQLGRASWQRPLLVYGFTKFAR